MPEENTENTQATQGTDGQQQQTTPEEPAGKQQQKAGEPPAEKKDEPLGEAGKKALQEERDARKDLEKQLNTFRSSLAEVLGGETKGKGGKSEIEQLSERLANHEQELATERQARWRAEVAHEKGLTAQQAERLVGNTHEELTTDADALLSLFPAAQSNGPRQPKPDPSQGAKGGGTAATDLDSRIAEAEEKGDTKTVIALKARKLTQQK